jgi:hypothetical protein
MLVQGSSGTHPLSSSVPAITVGRYKDLWQLTYAVVM